MMNFYPEMAERTELNEIVHPMKHASLTLTVPQMAKALNISRNTAYELVKQPGFPCFHVGKRILVNRDLLQDWLNDQCCQTA